MESMSALGLSSRAGLFHERLDVGDVAAEVTHYGEGMGEECLRVGVGHLPAGVSVDAVHVNGGAVKSYLCHGVNLLAHAAVSYDLVSLESGFGEVVVEVAAEVEVLLCGVVYHFAGFGDVVGDGLFNEDMAACVESFHSGDVMPGAVFKTGGSYVNDFDFGMRGEHILEGIESGNAEFLTGFIRLFGDNVADGNKLCEGVVFDAASVGMTDAAHTDDARLEDFFHKKSLSLKCDFKIFFFFYFLF